jgi:hypothetical protein
MDGSIGDWSVIRVLVTVKKLTCGPPVRVRGAWSLSVV